MTSRAAGWASSSARTVFAFSRTSRSRSRGERCEGTLEYNAASERERGRKGMYQRARARSGLVLAFPALLLLHRAPHSVQCTFSFPESAQEGAQREREA